MNKYFILFEQARLNLKKEKNREEQRKNGIILGTYYYLQFLQF